MYLHCAECTGCTEALLRAYEPTIDEIILSTISLDYCETLMCAAGEAAHGALEKALKNPEGYICVIEGGIPTFHGGEYCKVGGETTFQLCARVASKAIATIAMGSCACFGGVQAAAPNPSGAKGVNDALGAVGVKAINIAGCPPNPMNFVGTVVICCPKACQNWMPGTAASVLQPYGARQLPAPEALQQWRICIEFRQSGSQKRLVPVPTRLQGALYLQQLSDLHVQSGELAGQGRSALHRVQRTRVLG